MQNGLKELAVAMTCSYPESGLTGLAPVGFVVHGSCYCDPKPLCRKKALDDLRVKAAEEGATHVFNVRFEERTNGHPSNGEYQCIATGDGYAVLSVVAGKKE